MMSDNDDWIPTDEEEALFLEEEESPAESPGAAGKSRGRPKAVKPPLASCVLCVPKRGFTTLEGYKAHMKIHLLEELYQSAPCQSAVKDKCRSVYQHILESVLQKAEKYTAGLTKEVKPLISELLSKENNEFVDAVADLLWKCVPPLSTFKLTEFHRIYVRAINQFFSRATEREELMECLIQSSPSVKNFSSGALNWFLCEFVRRMGEETEAFYLSAMREPREVLMFGSGGLSKEADRDDVEDTEFQETVYYVGGSVVRSVLSVAMRSLNNPKWNAVDTFIRRKVLVGELVSEPDAAIVEWTKSVNRGGLKFIGEAMWTFLMGLVCVLRVGEKKDGSLLHSEVLSSVRSDPGLIVLWSEVVEESLSEEHSDFLLAEICRYFVNAWGRGAALRHRNAILGRNRDKIALRASLASKK